MLNPLRELRALRDEGKVHKKLIGRIRFMLVAAAILLCFTVYNLILHPDIAPLALFLAMLGFFLGFYVFSRMSKVAWNEQEEEVSALRMDVLGFATIGLYILFEIGLRTLLKDFYPSVATPLLLAGIFGTILGRTIGTAFEIHRAYLAAHR